MDGISDKKETNCDFEQLIMFLSMTFKNKKKPWSAGADKVCHATLFLLTDHTNIF